MEKIADPDQKPADLDLHCFLKMIYLGSAGKGLTHEWQLKIYSIQHLKILLL